VRAECIKAVQQAVGRKLNQQEVNGIEERILGQMRQLAKQDPAAWSGMSQADRLKSAADGAKAEMLHEATLKAERAAMQVSALSKTMAHLDTMGTPFESLKGLAKLIGFNPDGKTRAFSIESVSNAIRNDALSRMLSTLEASNPKFFGLLENEQGIRDIITELHGERSGNPDAAAGAKQFKDVSEQLRQRFNRAGGDVGKLDDWGMPHHHSQVRVREAGPDKWIAAILPMLRRDKYVNVDGSMMNDAQLMAFLKEAHTTIASDGANKLTPGQFSGGGARANRGKASRQIHFKDADSYMKYQEQFGERGLYEIIIGHISGVTKDIALTETFGPNPDLTFRTLNETYAQKAKVDQQDIAVGKIDKEAIWNERLYNEVAGKQNPTASLRMAAGFDAMRNWMVSTRLGSAIISSIADESTMAITARLNGLPITEMWRHELSALNPTNKMEARMANRAGLALNSMIADLNRFANDSLKEGVTSKLAGLTMRLSGLNALTDARRRAFGTTMISTLGRLTKDYKTLADLSPDDHRILLSKGLTETDWQVWRKAMPEDWGNGHDTMLTAEAVYSIPDAKLAGMGDPVTLREQAATKLLAHVLEETNMAVIEPGAWERTLMHGGMQRGTLKGELTKSVFLFKSFGLSMVTRHFRRAWNMPTNLGTAGYIAALAATSTLLGALAVQVNEMLSGRDPRNMASGKFAYAAMMKGGGFGILGDFAFSDTTQYGNSMLATAAGPMAGLAEDVFNLTKGNIAQAARGEETNAGAEVVRFAKGNIPVIGSLWYTKAALNHLFIYQLQEMASPGYLGRMEGRARREFGQDYWWAPGDVTPQDSPDFSKGWQ
jgi:hypothetical protein